MAKEAEQALNEHVYIHYTNWRGVTSLRKIRPTGRLLYTSNEFHPEPQWLLEAVDLEHPDHPIKLFSMEPSHLHGWARLPPVS